MDTGAGEAAAASSSVDVERIKESVANMHAELKLYDSNVAAEACAVLLAGAGRAIHRASDEQLSFRDAADFSIEEKTGFIARSTVMRGGGVFANVTDSWQLELDPRIPYKSPLGGIGYDSILTHLVSPYLPLSYGIDHMLQHCMEQYSCQEQEKDVDALAEIMGGLGAASAAPTPAQQLAFQQQHPAHAGQGAQFPAHPGHLLTQQVHPAHIRNPTAPPASGQTTHQLWMQPRN